MTRYLKTLVALVVAFAAAAGGSRDAWSEENHGALALGMSADGRRVTWAYESANSELGAKDAALSRCAQLFGTPCSTYLHAFEDTCLAISVSACPAGDCIRPAYGVSEGYPRDVAIAGAIEACESAALHTAGNTAGMVGTCRVANANVGNTNPGVVCVGTAGEAEQSSRTEVETDPAVRDPQDAAPEKWEAIVLGFDRPYDGTDNDYWVRISRRGDSRAAAESAAKRACEEYDVEDGDFRCRDVAYLGAFSNSCAALAMSDQGVTSNRDGVGPRNITAARRPGFAVAGALTREEAETAAVAACEDAVSRHVARGGQDFRGTCGVEGEGLLTSRCVGFKPAEGVVAALIPESSVLPKEWPWQASARGSYHGGLSFATACARTRQEAITKAVAQCRRYLEGACEPEMIWMVEDDPEAWELLECSGGMLD